MMKPLINKPFGFSEFFNSKIGVGDSSVCVNMIYHAHGGLLPVLPGDLRTTTTTAFFRFWCLPGAVGVIIVHALVNVGNRLSFNAGDSPALVHCEILLRKPIETIAKYYTKWYDFAYIIKREGLKNQ